MKEWTKARRTQLRHAIQCVTSIMQGSMTLEYPDGVKESIKPAVTVSVSDNFYRSARCRMCKRCCSSSAKFWTDREFFALEKIHPNLVHELPEINGVEWSSFEMRVNESLCKFYLLPETPDVGCVFLDRVKGCLIHGAHPVYCALPVIKFRQNATRRHTTVTKEQFGRSYNIGCPIEYGVLTRKEFTRVDLEVMHRVKLLAEDLSVSSRIDWVMKALKASFKDPVRSANIKGL